MPDLPNVRKRVRLAAPPQVRKRVRATLPEDPVEDKPKPRAWPRRYYTSPEAEALAGTPEDPVARGAYSNADMVDFSVHSDGPGDKMIGKLWKRPDGSYHLWGITMQGNLRYLGAVHGVFRTASDRLHAECRSIALARSRMKNPPILYTEYKTR